MMSKRTATFALSLLTLVVTAGLLMAGDEKAAAPTAADEAMMAAMTPGEHHEHLAATAGNWEVALKMWMDPSQTEPVESTGTAKFYPVMGGRYMVQEYSGDWMGMEFTGRGTTGYDNLAGKYVSTWVDNMSTTISMESGHCDGTGRKYDWAGEMPDPISGDMVKTRTEQTIEGNRMRLTSYAVTDGGERKMMEIVYTRKSS
ncbi:MAG: DUF1579 domain-containing protein [Acidobacteria bacterium]|nr:DUF1579 domain-containing protein [Acidobacteriota bacterium]